MIPVCYDTNSKKNGKCVASNQPTCSQYLYEEESKETEEEEDEYFFENFVKITVSWRRAAYHFCLDNLFEVIFTVVDVYIIIYVPYHFQIIPVTFELC